MNHLTGVLVTNLMNFGTMKIKLLELLTSYFPSSDLSTLESLSSEIEVMYCGEKLKPLSERMELFKQLCSTLVLDDKSNSREVSQFYFYWSENSGKPNSKLRFEKEKTFDISLRWKRWQQNSKKFAIVGMLNKGK